MSRQLWPRGLLCPSRMVGELFLVAGIFPRILPVKSAPALLRLLRGRLAICVFSIPLGWYSVTLCHQPPSPPCTAHFLSVVDNACME